jgi:hypothetical protein
MRGQNVPTEPEKNTNEEKKTDPNEKVPDKEGENKESDPKVINTENEKEKE